MLVIRNFGHLWARDGIFWGWQGVAGHLKGEAGDVVADFRGQIGVYVLYDPDKHPIYVGQAGYGEQTDRRLFARLKDHTTDRVKDYWKFVSWFGMRQVNDTGALSNHHTPGTGIHNKKIRDGLNEVEAVLIEVINPRSNRRGPNWGSASVGAQEFSQLIDDRLVDLDARDIAVQELRLIRRALRDREQED